MAWHVVYLLNGGSFIKMLSPSHFIIYSPFPGCLIAFDSCTLVLGNERQEQSVTAQPKNKNPPKFTILKQKSKSVYVSRQKQGCGVCFSLAQPAGASEQAKQSVTHPSTVRVWMRGLKKNSYLWLMARLRIKQTCMTCIIISCVK